MVELEPLHCLIKYCVGQSKAEEASILVTNLREARDFAHMSLRFAVRIQEVDNGAAELFDVESGKKLGRMAVLFDETGTVDHEQWTWIDGNSTTALH